MSDSDTMQAPKTVIKPRQKLSEAGKIARQANLAKAREARKLKAAQRRDTKDENEELLKELLAEKKAAKSAKFAEPVHQKKAAETQNRPVLPQACVSVESEPDEQDAPEPETQSEESEESEDETQACVSSETESDSEAEFELTRVPPKAKQACFAVKAKAEKVEKVKGKGKKETVMKKSKILEQMEQMAAELAALRKEKKAGRVNVYVNQPDKKGITDAKKQVLMNL